MRRMRHKARYDTRVHAPRPSIARALGSALSLAVVVFNLLAPVLLPPTRLDAGAGAVDPALIETAKLLGQTIVICTPAGNISIGPDGEPVQQSPGGGHSRLCAFCLPLVGGACTAPAAAAPVVYTARSELLALRPRVTEWVVARVRAGISEARAPPFA